MGKNKLRGLSVRFIYPFQSCPQLQRMLKASCVLSGCSCEKQGRKEIPYLNLLILFLISPFLVQGISLNTLLPFPPRQGSAINDPETPLLVFPVGCKVHNHPPRPRNVPEF